ncbi:Oidioi.mRNA.OKI2018_I69.PAR.g8955.t1.cds [Oikopleura dioica]|uniref:Oidioi.mRNA.OKI2018_I69.PAR.g8955.t1.cds n=1 Tax=Oikopleura dioica TaxID=34765 RepID=A0ABN7RKZ8_OIKDI|nr:Oidioi.mRNA.OKI2018_I69.PAR.g8955.t1.cds [Oikopleura dioica]
MIPEFSKKTYFILSMMVTLMNTGAFILTLVNYFNVKETDTPLAKMGWTWLQTGPVVTYAQTGFWYPIENWPRYPKKWWTKVKPTQICIFAFSSVAVICHYLVALDLPEKPRTTFIIVSVLLSLSGTISWVVASSGQRNECEEKCAPKSKSDVTVIET